MMTIKRFGAAVGVTAVLAAIPLATLGTESSTTGAVPVAAAAPTTLYPGDPGYDDARQWERDLPSYTAPATATHTVTVTPTTTTKPSPATKNEGGGGFPWWGWVLGTLGVIGGLLWWATTLDDSSAPRAARDDDDEPDDDGQYPTPRNSAEEAVLDRWEEREEARERAGGLPRRYPTTHELREMTRLGVADYDQLPGSTSVLSYPAIPTPVSEPVPYPEPPSVPAAPAPSGSLMDRLGGK